MILRRRMIIARMTTRIRNISIIRMIRVKISITTITEKESK